MEDAREKHLQKELADCVLSSSWFYCVAGLSCWWRSCRPGIAAPASLLLWPRRAAATTPRLLRPRCTLWPVPSSAGVALAVPLGVKKKVEAV